MPRVPPIVKMTIRAARKDPEAYEAVYVLFEDGDTAHPE